MRVEKNIFQNGYTTSLKMNNRNINREIKIEEQEKWYGNLNPLHARIIKEYGISQVLEVKFHKTYHSSPLFILFSF